MRRVLHLRSGASVLVRPLTAADRDGYVAALENLSAHSRYLRFAAPKPRFTRREIDYLTDVDGVDHVALVATAAPGCSGVAVARYVRTGDGAAEVAIAVVDAWQGRGLGSALCGLLIEHARDAGLVALDATVLGENVASRALLARFGFVPAGADGGQLGHRLALAAAHAPTLAA